MNHQPIRWSWERILKLWLEGMDGFAGHPVPNDSMNPCHRLVGFTWGLGEFKDLSKSNLFFPVLFQNHSVVFLQTNGKGLQFQRISNRPFWRVHGLIDLHHLITRSKAESLWTFKTECLSKKIKECSDFCFRGLWVIPFPTVACTSSLPIRLKVPFL